MGWSTEEVVGRPPGTIVKRPTAFPSTGKPCREDGKYDIWGGMGRCCWRDRVNWLEIWSKLMFAVRRPQSPRKWIGLGIWLRPYGRVPGDGLLAIVSWGAAERAIATHSKCSLTLLSEHPGRQKLMAAYGLRSLAPLRRSYHRQSSHALAIT